MKRSLRVGVVSLVVGAALSSFAADGVSAICVPWRSNEGIAHYTYSGATVTLKGIARGPATQFRWDFGDGQATPWAPILDPYNLGVEHPYTGFVGELFFAQLYVKDAEGTVSEDDYLISIFESADLNNRTHLQVRINMAIDEGLWWLHTNMIRLTFAGGSPGYSQPYGYWDVGSSDYNIGALGTCVDAFQLHGSKANADYDSDPYVETVRRGLNALLYNTYAFSITGGGAPGNPDLNGNGIGVVTNHNSALTDTRQTYLGGICMAALATSGAPSRVATVGRDGIVGRTYAAIVQDMVEFFAWGQVDSGTGRGGWRYHANYGDSDMSTTQWPPLGMLAAIENMGSTVPDFVGEELILFLTRTQNTERNERNGCFGYANTTDYLNVTKAAAGIICHEFLGSPLTDPRLQSAIGYIYRHWNDTGTDWANTQLHGNSYGMYGVMKAMKFPEPDIRTITEYDYAADPPQQTQNSFDWYFTPHGQSQEGLASYIVRTQQNDGHWDDTVGPNAVYGAFCTGWRILILLDVVLIKPVAIICDCEKQEYNLNQDVHLDGSCSFHPDRNRTIVTWEWDLDNDGTFEAEGTTVRIPRGFAEIGEYPVTLQVWDENPEGRQSSSYICLVRVHEPPHCPHAYPHPDPSGIYLGSVGAPVVLDGSASWDPDNAIAAYDWDLDNDGLFGAEDDDCFGEPSDGVGEALEWTWYEPYRGRICLRVTDAEGEFPSCSRVDCTRVEIGNRPPVCDHGGPYAAHPDGTVTLDATRSYDPDPGDEISVAWDLDNDGEYDDSTEWRPEFTVGDTFGRVYDICVEVTDSFGESCSACTTVKVEFPLVRGDVNADGKVNIADPVALLSYLFRGGATPPCLKAADANDSSQVYHQCGADPDDDEWCACGVNLSDSIYLLCYCLLRGQEPPAPFPMCGPDVTIDSLTCESFPPCER
ncbi:MAG: hypothetical protein JW741_19115 [Sedimentisphaerales bacterium]|nr:hypothetical protein [Sedimentisphaerales bacterium]